MLKSHARFGNEVALDLNMINSGNCPIERSRWQHLHLLPLCRAVIIPLDELLPTLIEMNDTISLDEEVRRQIAVCVLTDYGQDLR